MKVRPSVVLIHNKQVLLMQYRYGNTLVYNLPGGKPDPNETMPQTIIRELYEEMSIDVSVGSLLLCGEVILPNQKTVLHCIFEGTTTDKEPRLNPNETSAIAIAWQPIDSLDKLTMYPNVGLQLKEILLGTERNTYIGQIAQKWY